MPFIWKRSDLEVEQGSVERWLLFPEDAFDEDLFVSDALAVIQGESEDTYSAYLVEGNRIKLPRDEFASVEEARQFIEALLPLEGAA